MSNWDRAPAPSLRDNAPAGIFSPKPFFTADQPNENRVQLKLFQSSSVAEAPPHFSTQRPAREAGASNVPFLDGPADHRTRDGRRPAAPPAPSTGPGLFPATAAEVAAFAAAPPARGSFSFGDPFQVNPAQRPAASAGAGDGANPARATALEALLPDLADLRVLSPGRGARPAGDSEPHTG